MSSASTHVLLTAASTAALVAALTVLLQSHLGKLASRRKAAALSPERKRQLLDSGEREDLHKALAEVMELVGHENENGAALERVQEKLRWLEGKLLAHEMAMDEHTDAFEEALCRHLHQTAATLTPLRNEVGQLKDQLNELAVLLGGTPAPDPRLNGSGGGGKQQPRRPLDQSEGSGVSGSFGAEATKSNFSHLATVATALGMKAAFEERARTGSVDAATPAYIISDWSQLSLK